MHGDVTLACSEPARAAHSILKAAQPREAHNAKGSVQAWTQLPQLSISFTGCLAAPPVPVYHGPPRHLGNGTCFPAVASLLSFCISTFFFHREAGFRVLRLSSESSNRRYSHKSVAFSTLRSFASLPGC